MVVTIVILFWLGICFGSFVNALVWRTRQQSLAKKKTKDKRQATNDYSVLTGRSMCPNCRHELKTLDLVPIFSWLGLKGRCRYCHKAISWQYPLVELAGGVVFAISYYFLIDGTGGAGGWLLFITWLLTSVGLLALLVYDFRWMILPNRILYPTFCVALAGRLAYIVLFSDKIASDLWSLVMSITVSSGIFWLMFMASKGRWIGYGDVRLGLITGTVLASPALSTLMIFGASLLGMLFALPGLARGSKNLVAKIPFGPFLIASTWLCLLFGDKIIDWYKGLMLVS
jgi:leader peptidase (prepilin peptidase)/N-methyltransferase